MNDIKTKLLGMGRYGFTSQSMKDCKEAAAHIEAQERRIAGLEAEVSAQASMNDIQEMIGIAHFLRAQSNMEAQAYSKILAEIASRMIAAPPAPTNAIDAEPPVSDECILAAAHKFIDDTIMHPNNFWTYDHHLIALGRTIIAAMKAAK